MGNVDELETRSTLGEVRGQLPYHCEPDHKSENKKMESAFEAATGKQQAMQERQNKVDDKLCQIDDNIMLLGKTKMDKKFRVTHDLSVCV